MNPYDFYITPDEYERAESFGVDTQNLDRRVRLLGWEKEKAITTPLGNITDRSQWSEVAKSNDIKYQTFMNRVLNLGWSEERAATTPVISKVKQAKKLNEKRAKNRIIATDIVKLAENNDISYHTLRARIQKQNLDPYTAATKPVMTKKEIQRMGVEAYERIYGRFNSKIFK